MHLGYNYLPGALHPQTRAALIAVAITLGCVCSLAIAQQVPTGLTSIGLTSNASQRVTSPEPALAEQRALAALTTAPTPETFESFTEPVRTVRLSVAEPGRIAQMHVRRGDHVSAAALLLELDCTVLAANRQVLTTKLASRAVLTALEVERDMQLQRSSQLQALQEKGAGTPDEARRAIAEAEVARLNVLAAEEERAIGAQEIAELDARLEQRRVRAPFDGLITEVYYEEGEFVSPANPHVITIVDLDELRVTFYLPTRLALQLRQDQTTSVQLLESNIALPAEVVFVAAVTSAESGLVRIDLKIDNHGEKVRSGVRCRWTPLASPLHTMSPNSVSSTFNASTDVEQAAARPQEPR